MQLIELQSDLDGMSKGKLKVLSKVMLLLANLQI